MRRAAATAFAVLVLGVACSGDSGQPAAARSGPSTAQPGYTAVVKAVGRSVVEIGTKSGLGSGVVYDTLGDIVTNSHVVGDARQVIVTTNEGKQLPATVLNAYPPDDLAVVRVSAGDLKPAVFADSAKVEVGEIVLAIGSPLGLQSSVTEGIVSATGRVVNEGPNIVLPDTIQTSAAINPGNSGGALVDLDGQVVGIPTLAAVSPGQVGGLAPGIGFAISSNRAKSIADQIVKSGRVTNSQRAFLGIQAGETDSGAVLVTGILPNGPADRAGIRAGDLISSVAGKPTPTNALLAQVLATLQPGQSVPVVIHSGGGERRTVTAQLGEYPGG